MQRNGEEQMKLISWNVNGLRAVMGKNFMEEFKRLDADFFCLQETKLQAGQIELELPGYHQYWNYAEKKGYSGTAIFAKQAPLNVTYGLGMEEHDHEGRVITLEYSDFYLITVYTPNSQDELKRLDYRMQWEDDFRAYLNRLAEDYHLSQREKEIATLLCKGKNNNDIAADLYLSPNTVKVHTSNLYRKLGVKNRVQAVQVLRGDSLEE